MIVVFPGHTRILFGHFIYYMVLKNEVYGRPDENTSKDECVKMTTCHN